MPDPDTTDAVERRRVVFLASAGDADPQLALDGALRLFPADEILVAESGAVRRRARPRPGPPGHRVADERHGARAA
jgi:hypothetical protein